MGWAKVELRNREIISQIQPTVILENHRKIFVQYVQHLVHRCIGCEVLYLDLWHWKNLFRMEKLT